MKGQWKGTYEGTNTGLLVIDVDDMGTHFEGRAYVWDNRPDMPSSFVFIKTPDKSKKFRLTNVPVYPIDPRTITETSWEQIRQLFPTVTFPATADIDFDWNQKRLKASWVTNIGTNAHAELPRTLAGTPSNIKPRENVRNWQEFKTFVNKLEHRKFIFRGQRKPWRLRTNFHRTDRADLTRFINDDIPTLLRHLSSRTAHLFNLRNPDENGAFFNLVQHHGYPTPLLDWTYSPYVSAFFAYRSIKNSEAEAARASDVVRVLIFDQKQWRSDFVQLQKLTPNRPHFSIMEFLAINNERLVPQQGISSVTNIDDIESYLSDAGKLRKKEYIEAIDLPVSERRMVMQDLSAMGITAGSMFPGLDGACEELRERFFQS